MHVYVYISWACWADAVGFVNSNWGARVESQLLHHLQQSPRRHPLVAGLQGAQQHFCCYGGGGTTRDAICTTLKFIHAVLWLVNILVDLNRILKKVMFIYIYIFFLWIDRQKAWKLMYKNISFQSSLPSGYQQKNYKNASYCIKRILNMQCDLMWTVIDERKQYDHELSLNRPAAALQMNHPIPKRVFCCSSPLLCMLIRSKWIKADTEDEYY